MAVTKREKLGRKRAGLVGKLIELTPTLRVSPSPRILRDRLSMRGGQGVNYLLHNSLLRQPPAILHYAAGFGGINSQLVDQAVYLPAKVLEKIYRLNAEKLYPGI